MVDFVHPDVYKWQVAAAKAKADREWAEGSRLCGNCGKVYYHGRINGGKQLECYNCRHVIDNDVLIAYFAMAPDGVIYSFDAVSSGEAREVKNLLAGAEVDWVYGDEELAEVA